MKYSIDIYEFMKLAELCFYSQTGVSICFIDRAIDEYHNMPVFDKQKMKILRDQLLRNLDLTDKKLNERQEKFLARYDPDNQYKVTVRFEGKEETRYMYMYKGRYLDGKSTFAPKENIHEVIKLDIY